MFVAALGGEVHIKNQTKKAFIHHSHGREGQSMFFFQNMYKAFEQNANIIYNMLYVQYLIKCGYIGCPKKRYRRLTYRKAENPPYSAVPPIPSEAQANPDLEIETTQTEPKQSEEHQP